MTLVPGDVVLTGTPSRHRSARPPATASRSASRASGSSSTVARSERLDRRRRRRSTPRTPLGPLPLVARRTAVRLSTGPRCRVLRAILTTTSCGSHADIRGSRTRCPKTASARPRSTSCCAALLALENADEAYALPARSVHHPRDPGHGAAPSRSPACSAAGEHYTAIQEATGASATTISRVSKALNYGADGYKRVLERLGSSARAGRATGACPSSTCTPTPSTPCSTVPLGSTISSQRADELEMPALAITDHGYMYGAVDFYRTATAGGHQADHRLRGLLHARTRGSSATASPTCTTCCCWPRTTRATAT